MDFKKYLTDTFEYNRKANIQILKKIKKLSDTTEAVKLFSHLINCQFKWMARVVQDSKSSEMDWWNPIYKIDELESKWNESLQIWFEYLESKTEEELWKEVTFIGFDSGKFAATPADIALQLNYHSIHHRAQIQTIIRKQGLVPDFVDYIGTKYRKLT